MYTWKGACPLVSLLTEAGAAGHQACILGFEAEAWSPASHWQHSC